MDENTFDKIITATELKQNLGKYLDAAMDNHETIITKNGLRVVRLSPYVNDITRYMMVSEEAHQYGLGDMMISYEEFLEIREKSNLRMEYINGKIVIQSSPNSFHQEAVGNLYMLLKQFFKGKKCKVFLAPFDVVLHKIELETPDVLQPDLLVACDAHDKMTDRGRYEGIPNLVIEVLSPSTRSKDMIEKLNTFLNSGVKEYWIIDTDKKRLHQYGFSDYDIDVYELYNEGDRFNSYAFEELVIAVRDIFEE